MNTKQYIEEAVKTESRDFTKIYERLDNTKVLRALHAALGMVTESAELADAVKKYLFYGKFLDEVNLIEEIGDLFWYIAIALDTLGYDWEHVMKVNVRKLRERYQQQFTAKEAVERDVVREGEVMKGLR